MDHSNHHDLSRIGAILHPTDLSIASRTAFRHALKLALVNKAKLTILHVTGEDQDEEDWGAFPGVRDHLERWGLLPNAATMDDLSNAGLRIRKVSAQGSDPVAVCLDHLERHSADLLVMATSQREGPFGWPHSSVAERMARASGRPSLLIPHNSEGLVLADGTTNLSGVLVPVARNPSPKAAIRAATSLCGMLGQGAVSLALFHAGRREDMPDVLPTSTPELRWREHVVQADVVEGIVEAARSQDLVVMSTHGRKGPWDNLLGSTTERVLRRIQCPLLAIPVQGH
ncbi:MAG: universal stress protein [Flavobacteriales bacterium]